LFVIDFSDLDPVEEGRGRDDSGRVLLSH